MASPRPPGAKRIWIIVTDIDERGICDDYTIVSSSPKIIRSFFLRPFSLLECGVVRLEISDMTAIREGPLAQHGNKKLIVDMMEMCKTGMPFISMLITSPALEAFSQSCNRCGGSVAGIVAEVGGGAASIILVIG